MKSGRGEPSNDCRSAWTHHPERGDNVEIDQPVDFFLIEEVEVLGEIVGRANVVDKNSNIH